MSAQKLVNGIAGWSRGLPRARIEPDPQQIRSDQSSGLCCSQLQEWGLGGVVDRRAASLSHFVHVQEFLGVLPHHGKPDVQVTVQRETGIVGGLELTGWHQAGLVLADGDLIAATMQIEAGTGNTTSDGERGET
ncbi:MAG TPA: hypothetical protein VFO16_22715 [Pseudonocardiaceae bacterium]|nr:hypothetical protein [Pseudonocardiaceae bacterium]